jgi:hypothetical protein
MRLGPSSQQLKERLQQLWQWLYSHRGAIAIYVIAPLSVLLLGALITSLIANVLKNPDVTINATDLEPYYGGDVEGPAIYSDVSVSNTGDATAENCYVRVTDTQTQKDLPGSNYFNMPPAQGQTETVIISLRKVPEGHRYTRTYRLRAECRNDESTNLYRAINIRVY